MPLAIFIYEKYILKLLNSHKTKVFLIFVKEEY